MTKAARFWAHVVGSTPAVVGVSIKGGLVKTIAADDENKSTTEVVYVPVEPKAETINATPAALY